MTQNKYVVIAFSESGERDYSLASSLESAEKTALEFVKEGYIPEVYKLGEYIPIKAVDDFINEEYSNN